MSEELNSMIQNFSRDLCETEVLPHIRSTVVSLQKIERIWVLMEHLGEIAYICIYAAVVVTTSLKKSDLAIVFVALLGVFRAFILFAKSKINDTTNKYNKQLTSLQIPSEFLDIVDVRSKNSNGQQTQETIPFTSTVRSPV
jgi:prolipoprotein diacylglyceryltransferase